jgi:cell division transport system permease protein
LKLLHHGIEDMFNVPPLWITISFLPQVHSLAIVAILAAVGVLSSLVAIRN